MNTFLLVTLILGGACLLSWPLGRYMRWAMDPGDTGPRRRAFDRFLVRIAGPAAVAPQGWRRYTMAMLAFSR